MEVSDLSTVEERLEKLGIILPQLPRSIGSYVSVVQTGNLCFISGQLPTVPNEGSVTGTVEGTWSVVKAQGAARVCAINMLAQLKGHLGSLDRIKQIVQIQGFVRSDDDFERQSDVINGASDFLVELFGEAGKHTRTAVGVKQLPRGAVVELWGIVEVD